MTVASCLVCGFAALQEVSGFSQLTRVTSDCLPFAQGGRLFVCGHCAAVQKSLDSKWRGEIAQIYSTSVAHRQGGGHEQQVRDPMRENQMVPRSTLLLDRVKSVINLPQQGSALDFGCGSGVMLKALSDSLPGWSLDGYDLDDRALNQLEAIPHFREHYSGSIREIKSTYDLITLMHSLEHFDRDPVEELQHISKRLQPNGLLFVEVPNIDQNLFDVLVADHLFHFDKSSLTRVAQRAGFSPKLITNEWISKELSMIASVGQSVNNSTASSISAVDRYAHIQARVDWLAGLLSTARHAASNASKLGVLGTAIAGSWMAGGLGERVDFFVEDDPNRQGRQHLDRPILSVDQIPSGSTIIVPMEPAPAERISARLASLPVTVVSITQT